MRYPTIQTIYLDFQKDLKLRSPRTIGEIYKDYIGVVMGLYRGSNFEILPGVWVVQTATSREGIGGTLSVHQTKSSFYTKLGTFGIGVEVNGTGFKD